MQQPVHIQEPSDEESPSAAALYIAAIANELAHLAKRHDLETLSYILDMARLEADQVANNARRVINSAGPL